MSTASLKELMAASALIVTLERICSSGVLFMEDEIRARVAITLANQAFGLDSIAERPGADVIPINRKSY